MGSRWYDDRMFRSSRFSILFPVFLALLALAACSQKLPIDEGRMVIALPGAPVNVDPRVATDAYGEQILQMIFRPMGLIAFKDLDVTSLLRPKQNPGGEV